MRLLKKSTWILFLILSLTATLFCKKNNKTDDPDNPDPVDPANTNPVELVTTILTPNLNNPWEILWGPDNFIWMTERSGKVSRVNPANGQVTAVYTVPDVQSTGEGGLLGMVLDPNFNSNKRVYIVYDYNDNGTYRGKVVRLTYNGTTLTTPLVLKGDIEAANNHNGSRLVIVNDKIFITTGDANDPSRAQDETKPNGKVLRLNLDGSVPADNPIAGNAYWTMGHRNPQGLVYVESKDKLFSDEHGPDNDDEVNLIEKGRNYGWLSVQGFCDKPDEVTQCAVWNVREPLKAWTPTIAPAGLDFYNSNAIPQWKGSLLMCTLKDNTLYQHILSADFNSITDSKEFFRGKYGRLRDICISTDGKVYLCTDNSNGNDVIVEVKAK